MAPIVSAAIGTNKYDWLSEEYLFLFLSAAASAVDYSILFYFIRVSTPGALQTGPG